MTQQYSYKLKTMAVGNMSSTELYEDLYICCETLAEEGHYKASTMLTDDRVFITVKYTIGRKKEYIKVFADGEYLMDLDMYMPSYAYNNPDYNKDDDDNMVETLKMIKIISNKNIRN